MVEMELKYSELIRREKLIEVEEIHVFEKVQWIQTQKNGNELKSGDTLSGEATQPFSFLPA